MERGSLCGFGAQKERDDLLTRLGGEHRGLRIAPNLRVEEDIGEVPGTREAEHGVGRKAHPEPHGFRSVVQCFLTRVFRIFGISQIGNRLAGEEHGVLKGFF
ncbi:MAG: hypothetical protein ACE5IR_12270, partial [bacterium]